MEVSPAFFKQLYQFDSVYAPQAEEVKVWILVDYPQETLAPEASLDFLYKILGAMHLQRQHFKVSNVHTLEDAPTQYVQVWAFGTSIQKLIPTLPAHTLYVPQTHENITCLHADSLETLQNNPALKKQLWGVLQTLK